MSHIRKTASGRFEARYRSPDGSERSRRFGTRREAQAFLERVGVDRQRGEWRDPRAGRLHLEDWVREWKATTVNLRPSSRARDESYLRNHVEPAFGTVPLAKISQLDVRAWVAQLSAAGKAPATVHKAYQTLSKVLAAAVDAGLIAQTPCRNVPLPRIERKEMRFLTPDEIATLAAEIDPRYRGLVLFDAYCGLRLGELAGLRRERLDLLRRQVRVAEIGVEVRGKLTFGPPKTRAGHRTVPMPSFVADALADHLSEFTAGGGDAFVFPGADGAPLRANGWRARHWAPAIRRAGLTPLRPHDLRHTAVSLWIAAGANPNQVAAWAGHTSVAVVLDRYGHLFPGHEGAVLNRLEQLASASPVTDATVTSLSPGGRSTADPQHHAS